MTTAPSPIYQQIYATVRQIPAGRVTSYGKIAEQVTCTARTVGFALAALPPNSDVPWQRVVNRLGQVSTRRDGEGNILQRDLLEHEGVRFDRQQRIDLATYGWDFPPSILSN